MVWAVSSKLSWNLLIQPLSYSHSFMIAKLHGYAGASLICISPSTIMQGSLNLKLQSHQLRTTHIEEPRVQVTYPNKFYYRKNFSRHTLNSSYNVFRGPSFKSTCNVSLKRCVGIPGREIAIPGTPYLAFPHSSLPSYSSSQYPSHSLLSTLNDIRRSLLGSTGNVCTLMPEGTLCSQIILSFKIWNFMLNNPESTMLFKEPYNSFI